VGHRVVRGLLARGNGLQQEERVTRWGAMASGLAVIPWALFAARDARADPVADADVLFQEGTRLIEAHRFAEACPKLAESQKLDPALGTLLYLAACHEKLGLTASAWSEFSSATEWAERTNQPDRAAFGHKHMLQLESTLARVVIRATEMPPGFELSVDDRAHGSAAAGTALPLDPGTHVIQGSAPGYRPWRTTVTVPGKAVTLTVDVPVLDPVVPVVATPPTHDAPTPTDGTAPTARAPESHALPWSAAGLATAGIVVGSVFGVMTFAERDSARAACPQNVCAPGGLDDVDRLRTYSTVSTVAFGAGIAGALAAGYLFLRDNAGVHGPGASAAAGSVTVMPAFSSRRAGLELRARF
jgi:hypothetical protein